MAITRCSWAEGDWDPLLVEYHDRDWGVPVHEDRLLFEMLALEGAQAGLSWMTILRKREAYRQAFRKFDPKVVARFDGRTVNRLLQSPAIVRNRRKIESAVKNAKVVLAIAAEVGSFDRYAWSFVGGRTRQNAWKTLSEIPSETPESKAMSKDLLRRGASFVGPTICYAFMQSVGLVNDHEVSCFRYKQLLKGGSPGR